MRRLVGIGRSQATVFVAATVLIATGCSGGDDSALTNHAAHTTTASATTFASTVPPHDATLSATTEAQTTVPAEPTTTRQVAASTAATTSTLPEGVPPRVTFPDDPEKQAVVDAYYAWSERDETVLADPQDGTRLEELLSSTSEPLRTRVEDLIEQLAAGGEAYVAMPEQPAYTEVFDFTVLIVDDLASFDGCSIDARLHVRLADGKVVEVLDDSVSSSVLTYNLRRVGGDWLVSDIVRVRRWEDQIGCG